MAWYYSLQQYLNASHHYILWLTMLRKIISLALLLIFTFVCQQTYAAHTPTPITKIPADKIYKTRSRVYKRTKKNKLGKTNKLNNNNGARHVIPLSFAYNPEWGNISSYSQWLSGSYASENTSSIHLADSAESVYSDHLRDTTEKVVKRLQAQLGKPYVWGGVSPKRGFDCSGLVFFAYNQHLLSRLPRTANEMYHFKRAHPVAKNELKRGDLLFFAIHSMGEHADHVGVYLGDGNFIESPRTGLTIRISHFDGDFWQDHYLGARRILTAKNIQ